MYDGFSPPMTKFLTIAGVATLGLAALVGWSRNSETKSQLEQATTQEEPENVLGDPEKPEKFYDITNAEGDTYRAFVEIDGMSIEDYVANREN